jgi:hypothetical protein
MEGTRAQVSLKPLYYQRDAVDALLHPLMVTLVGLGNQLIDLAHRNLPEDPVSFADREQNRVEHLVDALDDLGIAAFKSRSVATFSSCPLWL